jgi:hypothetical protein
MQPSPLAKTEVAMITLENLTIDDINLILAGLSELPTKSGAYPVAIKVKTQADAQLLPVEAAPEAE